MSKEVLIAQPVEASVEVVPVAQPAAQVPARVVADANELARGGGLMSLDDAYTGPAMGMPAPGMSLQQAGPPGAVVAVAAPGLGMLAGLQGICMRQNIRLAELLTGFEQKNRFKIMAKPPTLGPNDPLSDEITSQLPPIFWAIEDSVRASPQRPSRAPLPSGGARLGLTLSAVLCQECCVRQCCHGQRPFKMHILDGANTPVLELDRPFTCTCMCQGLCVCQPNEMTVKLPAGGVLGRIVQDNHMCVFSP